MAQRIRSPKEGGLKAFPYSQMLAGYRCRGYCLEIKLGGHCSFTSCNLYNPAYGNGIGESKSLSKPGASCHGRSSPFVASEWPL